MNEAAPPDTARDAFAISSDTLGHDLLAALLNELRQMPDHWLRLNEERQQKIIENLKDKIRGATDKAVNIFMRGEFPAVPAELDKIAWGSNITASLHVRRDALYRHALSDAQGQKVLIIVTDADRWTRRMDEIKARADQLDLWDADYDPSKDQPGYRRDQDRTLPGQSWAEFKKSLTPDAAQPPATDAPSATGDEAPQGEEGEPPVPSANGETPPVVDSDLPPEKIWALPIYALQEELAALGIAISFGALKARTDDELHQAKCWAEAYAADAGSCKIERPTWLPITDQGTQSP